MRSALLCLLLCACGGATPSPTPPPTIAKATVPDRAKPDLPSSAIRRSAVREALKTPAAFLQRIPVERPVFRGGKFHGFQIANVPTEWSIDLRSGDVVTTVNGFSVERPETAFEALQSLEVASELRVEYERDGEPRALRFTIVDD